MSTSNQSGLTPRSAAHARRSAKPPKKTARWGLRIMVLLLLLLLAVAVFLGSLVLKTKDAFNIIGDESAEEVSDEQSVRVKPVTFLLLGLDTRPKGGGMNTDVIKVVTMNPKTKTAAVVSVPRDAKIELNNYKSHKANMYYAIFYNQAIRDNKSKAEAHTHARQETREMFSRFFDVPIDYTVVINFNGFTDVVDALGGIDVMVDIDMRYIDNADGTNINLTAGQQVLDGKNALDFVRYRKSNQGTKQSSDLERNKRQSQVIGAIADQMMSLGGVPRLGSVIEAVGNNMKTDMNPKEIEHLMTTYFGMKSSSIQSLQLEGAWRSPYIHLDEGKLEEARAALKAKLDE